MKKISPALIFFVCFTLGSGILLSLVAAYSEPPPPETSGNELSLVLAAGRYTAVIPETLWQAFDSAGYFVGLAYRVFPRGYKGFIPILVGVDSAGVITGIHIDRADLKESPGLGLKVADSSFIGQLLGRAAEALKLKRDSGEVDAVSGATISSRAVCDGVRNGFTTYANYLIRPNEKNRVLPGAWNFTEVIKDTLWLAYRGPDTAGIVFKGKTMGYLDTIKFMVGVDRKGKITGVEVLSSHETEGVGERIRDPEFLDKFKDEIPDAISGATMSSRPFIKAIREGVERFRDYYRP
jgi:Na+-translocating ferredoxin:NAD+ oxidoreductase RnfG subunit